MKLPYLTFGSKVICRELSKYTPKICFIFVDDSVITGRAKRQTSIGSILSIRKGLFHLRKRYFLCFTVFNDHFAGVCRTDDLADTPCAAICGVELCIGYSTVFHNSIGPITRARVTDYTACGVLGIDRRIFNRAICNGNISFYSSVVYIAVTRGISDKAAGSGIRSARDRTVFKMATCKRYLLHRINTVDKRAAAYSISTCNSGIYDGNVLYSYCGIARKATRKERLFQAKSRFDYSSRFIGLDTYNGYLSDP